MLDMIEVKSCCGGVENQLQRKKVATQLVIEEE
jgi:hypothetical protein